MIQPPRERMLVLLIKWALDVGLFQAGLVAAFYLRYLPENPPPSARESLEALFTQLHTFGVTAPFTMIIPALVFPISGMYRRLSARGITELVVPVFQGVAVAAMLLAILVQINRDNAHIFKFPSSALLLTPVIASLLIVGTRMAYRFAWQLQEKSRNMQINLLIVGLSGLDEDTYRRITENDFPNYNVIGFLEGERRKEFEFHGGVKNLGDLRTMFDLIDRELIGEVLVVPSALGYEEFLNVIRICENKQVEYRILPSYFDMVASRAEIDLVNYVPLLHFGKPQISGWNLVFKRAMDIVVSLIAVVAMAPLFVVVGILIKLDSPGPVFFTQTRVGKRGRHFKVYKFRTMKQGSEKGAPLTAQNDPRVTKLGKFLRSYSIDEFPQLFNVLQGQMSLVGPRAVVPYVADKFNDLEKMTLNVLPGVTGLAQVSGRDAVSFRNKSMLNIYYIRNYSLLLDLKILLRTVIVVVSGEGNI